MISRLLKYIKPVIVVKKIWDIENPKPIEKIEIIIVKG